MKFFPALAISFLSILSFHNKSQAFQVTTGVDLGFSMQQRVAPTPNADAAKNNFLSSLSSFVTETFDDVPRFSADFRNAPIVSSNTIDSAGYAISGNNFLRVTAAVSSTSASAIDFSTPLKALGFYATNVERDAITSAIPSLEVTLSSGAIRRLGLPSNSYDRASVAYFGITAESDSEAFTSIRFRQASSRSEMFGIDDLTIARVNDSSTPVPEPMTIAGSFLGLGLLAALKKKYGRH